MKFIFSRVWIRVFLVLGALFDVVSTFLPWSVAVDAYLYLPWSPLLAGGWVVRALPFTVDFLRVSVVVRVAAVVGWAGVVLYEYVGIRVIWGGAVFVSGVLSFLAVGLFALTGLCFYLGAYLVLVGGVLKVTGIVVGEAVMKECLESRKSDENMCAPKFASLWELFYVRVLIDRLRLL